MHFIDAQHAHGCHEVRQCALSGVVSSAQSLALSLALALLARYHFYQAVQQCNEQFWFIVAIGSSVPVTFVAATLAALIAAITVIWPVR